MKGINFEEFLLCLLKISVKGRIYFKQFYNYCERNNLIDEDIKKKEKLEQENEEEIESNVESKNKNEKSESINEKLSNEENDKEKKEPIKELDDEELDKIYENLSIFEEEKLEKIPFHDVYLIDEMDPQTLEGFFLYLDLPENQKLLIKKFNSFKIENKKIAPHKIKKQLGISFYRNFFKIIINCF